MEPKAGAGATSFEERVTREARRFELRPLVDLLRAHGYPREQLLFQSTNERSGGSMVEAVEFRTRPVRCVVITVAFGLLGDNTLLPSYFFEVVERSPDPERFYDFLRFFDHRLIANLLAALYPEDGGAYRDFTQVRRSFFNMLGLASVSTLEWVAQLYFPELRVKAMRRAFASATASHAFRTGESRLDGTGILGRVYESDAAGFLIDLYAEEETDSRGRAWPNVVRERLNELVLPLLAPHRIPLVVRLRVLFHASWVRVDFPFTDEHGFLGYQRLRGDAEEGHTLVVYSGVTGERLTA